MSGSGIARADEVFTAGEVLGERYRVLRFVARGGMGEVYAAEDLLLEMRRVALKTLRPVVASDETAMRRFRREIQLAQRVTHPNVCRVFDLGFHTPDGGGPRVAFLSMGRTRRACCSGRATGSPSPRRGRRGPWRSASGLRPAFYFSRLRDSLDRAERKLALHSWHLNQLAGEAPDTTTTTP